MDQNVEEVASMWLKARRSGNSSTTLRFFSVSMVGLTKKSNTCSSAKISSILLISVGGGASELHFQVRENGDGEGKVDEGFMCKEHSGDLRRMYVFGLQ